MQINRIVSTVAAGAIALSILVPFYEADVKEAAVRAHATQPGDGTVAYEIDLAQRNVSTGLPCDHTGRAATASKATDACEAITGSNSHDTTGGRHVPGRDKV